MKGAIDQQVQELLKFTRGKRVAMLTNPSGVDGQYRPIADILHADPDVTLVAFFAPEHGLRGDVQAGGGVEDYIDPYTGVPVYSVYGSRKAPTPEQLENVDVLISDKQDVGVRFYTFVWTMTHCLEAAAENDVKFAVFDRPNPIGADIVQGAPNVNDEGLIGRKWPNAPFGVATRHGMTAGEIATLVNAEWMEKKADLTVIKVPNYRREMTFRETGYPWVFPSPNMPTLETAIVYPGMCIFEGSNVSEGRGTTQPFELCGAPFINGKELADALNAKGLPGVRFRQVSYNPWFEDFAGQFCHGVMVHVMDEKTFDPIRTGMTILKSMYEKYPEQVEIRVWASRLMGEPNLHERLKTESVESIIAGWQGRLDEFKVLRQKHLLYPSGSKEGLQVK